MPQNKKNKKILTIIVAIICVFTFLAFTGGPLYIFVIPAIANSIQSIFLSPLEASKHYYVSAISKEIVYKHTPSGPFTSESFKGLGVKMTKDDEFKIIYDAYFLYKGNLYCGAKICAEGLNDIKNSYFIDAKINTSDKSNSYLVSSDRLFFINNPEYLREIGVIDTKSIKPLKNGAITDGKVIVYPDFLGHIVVKNYSETVANSEKLIYDKDETGLYFSKEDKVYKDGVLLKDLTTQTFKNVGPFYYNNVRFYAGTTEIKSLDIKTLQFLRGQYYKDTNSVYYYDSIISGVDMATFQITEDKVNQKHQTYDAYDKNNQYMRGMKVDPREY